MYDLVPGDAISGSIAFTGFYELGLSQRVVEHATKGGLFVDVGANMGYFSLLWAGSSQSGKVIAIEAAPRNIALLQSNITRNHLEDRITLISKAAGNHSGAINFDTGPDAQTGWGGLTAGSSPTTTSVSMLRLDEELAGTDIAVLKIDTEGADTWVLFGCESLLKERRIQTIYFEQNLDRMKRLGIASSDALKFLQAMGYIANPLGPDKEQWIAYPK